MRWSLSESSSRSLSLLAARNSFRVYARATPIKWCSVWTGDSPDFYRTDDSKFDRHQSRVLQCHERARNISAAFPRTVFGNADHSLADRTSDRAEAGHEKKESLPGRGLRRGW